MPERKRTEIRVYRSLTRVAARVSATLRAFGVGAVLAICVAPVAPAMANTPAGLTADIPAQPLARALDAFARQTGLHFAYVSGLVRDKISNSVSAGTSAEGALPRLLEGTGLTFKFLTTRSVRILASSASSTMLLSPAPEGSPPSVAQIVVTGSRIPVPTNLSGMGPLQVVTSDEIALSGARDSVDVVVTLPQVITNAGLDGGNTSNFWGIATADLRGLGPQRTIVLMNGRRLGLGDSNTGDPAPAPDLDQIPLAMIDRVEVLAGGASATYGSDAIAGVVNFILKDHVQGIQVDGQYGFAQHRQHNPGVEDAESASGTPPPVGSIVDGFKRDLSVIAGTGIGDSAGWITGYFSYHRQNPIYGSRRDFADCAASSANSWIGDPSIPGVLCRGTLSSNAFTPNGGYGQTYSVVGNQFVPWPVPGSVPPPFFNFAPYRTLQRDDTRYQAGVLGHVALGDAATPYIELNFMDDRTLFPDAPSGLFQWQNALTPDGNSLVNCSNPLLSAQEAAILCTPAQIAADRAQPGSVSADVNIGRRNVEGRGRLMTFEHQSYRGVLGVGGKLGDAWTYDAHALYQYISLAVTSENFINLAAVGNALQVTTDSTGRAVCISGGNCVPYDIFTAGAVTAQQLAYLDISGHDRGANSEQIVHADVTGQLADYGLVMPWAHDGVAVNAGAEHRVETLRFTPDAAELAGDLSGFGGNFNGPGAGIGAVAIDRRFSVNEGFVELRVPLAQDGPLIEDLTIGGGYRYSDYSTVGATNTYRADLQFAPLPSARLRASFDHVVRAPNLIELYTPLSYGAGFTLDPCASTGPTPATASLAQCLHTGVTAAQYGNGIAQAFGGTSTLVQCVLVCGVANGGNPNLAPERADTWSLDITFTPGALPAITGSVDFFHILVKGEIGVNPADVTLSQCLATGDPTWCRKIVRTPTGALSGATIGGGGYVLENIVNTGSARVSGMDVQFSYRQPLPGRWGALGANLAGTWLQHNVVSRYRSAQSYDCAGLFGYNCLNGSVNPTWRHNLRLTWDTRWHARFSAQWRFIGRTGFDNNSPQSALQYIEEGFYDPVLTHVPNYSYVDLSTSWDVTPHVEVRAGVNNVLDKDPPFLAQGDISGVSSGVINTFPTYDVVGRSVFMAVRATF